MVFSFWVIFWSFSIVKYNRKNITEELKHGRFSVTTGV